MERAGISDKHQLVFKFLEDKTFQEMLVVECLKQMSKEFDLETFKYFCKDLYDLEEFYDMEVEQRRVDEENITVKTEIKINSRGALFDQYLRKYNKFLDEAFEKRPDGILNKIAMDKLETNFNRIITKIELFDEDLVELIYEISQNNTLISLEKYLAIDLDRNFVEDIRNNPNKDLEEEINIILSDMELQDRILRYTLADIAKKFSEGKENNNLAEFVDSEIEDYYLFINYLYGENEAREYPEDDYVGPLYQFLFHRYADILAHYVLDFEDLDEFFSVNDNMQERLFNIFDMAIERGEYCNSENITGIEMLSEVLF